MKDQDLCKGPVVGGVDYWNKEGRWGRTGNTRAWLCEAIRAFEQCEGPSCQHPEKEKQQQQQKTPKFSQYSTSPHDQDPSSSSSSPLPPLTQPAASLVFQKHTRHISTAGPLYSLFPLPVSILPQIFTWLIPSLHSGLCPHVTFSERPSLTHPLTALSLLNHQLPITISSLPWFILLEKYSYPPPITTYSKQRPHYVSCVCLSLECSSMRQGGLLCLGSVTIPWGIGSISAICWMKEWVKTSEWMACWKELITEF